MASRELRRSHEESRRPSSSSHGESLSELQSKQLQKDSAIPGVVPHDATGGKRIIGDDRGAGRRRGDERGVGAQPLKTRQQPRYFYSKTHIHRNDGRAEGRADATMEMEQDVQNGAFRFASKASSERENRSVVASSDAARPKRRSSSSFLPQLAASLHPPASDGILTARAIFQ